MTGEPVARVKDVSHRYGATVSLADVSIDIPSRIMVGVIGPDGVGKSTLLGLIAGVKTIQAGEVFVFDKSIADKETLREIRGRIAYMPQGLGPQSLSDAQRVREHRLLRPPVRIVRGGAPLQDRRASYGDEPGEVRSASRRQAFRRHEAEAQPLLRAHQRSRPAHSRRADDRRRSAVARPVLGPHQHDPRPPAADERHCRHRLYGRGRALRLADGDGRRQDHRHRHAEGASRQDRRAQSRRGVHRHDAGSQARPAQESGRASRGWLPRTRRRRSRPRG